MIARNELKKIAQGRLKDAQALLAAKRYDGAIYIAGYSIELRLKARICITLKWKDFPSTNKEFQNYQSFRTHDLDVLLTLSGREDQIKSTYLAQWSAVAQWNPEARYQAVGTATISDALLMVWATKVLLKAL